MTPAPHPREVAAQPAAATGYRAALAAIRQSVAPVTLTEHEPTVVRVTIGRIDVRSTAPPTEPRPPAQAPPLDNRLADYLTRKTGDRP
jgi:hypothetical protein